jgi:short-subunit dehydrogenase
MYRARPADGVAWVTGASSGIGREVAQELVRRGYKVAATSRRSLELDALEKRSRDIFSFPCDITDRAAAAGTVSRIERDIGPIALAFLNAGIYFIAERKAFSAEIVWRTFETNIGGTVNCLDPLLAAMERRGKGQIAITASLAGYGGIGGSAAYGSTKAALINMAEALMLTYGNRGITVQIVNPGFVHTAMTAENKFKMPWIMDAQRAAARICEGFEKSGFEIAVPRRLAFSFKAMRLLPYVLYFRLMRRAARRA